MDERSAEERWIRDEYGRGSIGVLSIVDKMKENRLRMFGRVMRREETKTVRMVMKMNVEGKRGRGRPKKRRLDKIENDMRAAGVCKGDVKDRDKWRSRTTPNSWQKGEGEEEKDSYFRIDQ